MAEPVQPNFTIEKVYVKDCSLEVPNAPQIFLEQTQPQIEIQLQTAMQLISEGLYESTLTITVTAKLAEKTFFLAEAAQAGIFQIRNFPAEDMDAVLGVACPSVLFPYAREAIASLVNRAGFPPINLAPINFEMLFMQQRATHEAEQQPKIEIAH